MQRRSFLKGTGVISVLLAGGIVWRAREQGVFSAGEGRAYEPWQDWRSDPGTGPLALVRAAILAARMAARTKAIGPAPGLLRHPCHGS